MSDVVGSVLSAVIGGSAAQSAAQTQANATIQAAQDQLQATNNSIAFQQQALATQQADLQPYMQAGNATLPTLAAILGQSGSLTPQQIMEQDPGYQFRMNQGQTALENNAAVANGPGLSGATLQALTQYGQNYASNEFNNIFTRNMDVANLGQASAAGSAANTGAAANSIGNTITSGATAAGNLLTSGAAAQAAGTIGTANALTSAIGNYNSQQTLKSIFGGGGGYGTQAPAPVQYGPSVTNTPDPYSTNVNSDSYA